MESFLLKIRTKTRMVTFATLIHHYSGGPEQLDKKNKRDLAQYEKREKYVFLYDTILCK